MSKEELLAELQPTERELLSVLVAGYEQDFIRETMTPEQKALLAALTVLAETRRRLRGATARERERCAAIADMEAEQLSAQGPGTMPIRHAAAAYEYLAARIRSGQC